MHNLSMTQALDIWTDLDYARNNNSHFELYAYRLVPYSPSAVANCGDCEHPAVKKQARQAWESLISLLRYFKELHPTAEIYVGGVLLGDLLGVEGLEFHYRTEIRVEDSEL